MKFFKKLFGGNKKKEEEKDLEKQQKNLEKEVNRSYRQLNGDNRILHYLISFRKDKKFENVRGTFQICFNQDLITLINDEAKFISWLEYEDFDEEELINFSDLLSEITLNLLEQKSDKKLIMLMANSVNNIALFAATERTVSKLEKISENAKIVMERITNDMSKINNPQESNNPEAKATLSKEEKRFKKEIEEAIPYYFSNPDLVGKNIDFTVQTPSGELVEAYQEYPNIYNQWKTIKSVWDRRSIIFTLLDKLYGNKLELWQMLDRFTDDRYSQRAIDIAKQHSQEIDFKNANYWCALGRAQFHSGNNIDAEKSYLKCLEIDPNHKKGKINYADLLHCTSREKKAHEIYDKIMKTSEIGNEKKNYSLKELVGFDGCINSPIYAIAWLENHPDVTEEVWNDIAGEYYYSPYFRVKHAYYLIQKKENLKGFAKLNSLSQEFPWYKEGVINAYSIINQLGLDQAMKADKARLANIIELNNWGNWKADIKN